MCSEAHEDGRVLRGGISRLDSDGHRESALADGTGAPTSDPASRHYVVPAHARAGVAAKLATLAQVKAQLKAMQSPPRTHDITSYTLPGPVDHKEGAGNPCTLGTADCTSKGHPSYTCAANSTRNMIQMLTGEDYGEKKFVDWEGIRPGIGLPSINNIADTLNSHFGKYGSWTTHLVKDKADYLSGIETDTLVYGQAVIQDLKTGFFRYWGFHSLAHYNVAYGWNATDKTVAIAEGWNPTWTFGHPSTYGNPYGLRPHIPLGEAADAVMHSATGRYVL